METEKAEPRDRKAPVCPFLGQSADSGSHACLSQPDEPRPLKANYVASFCLRTRYLTCPYYVRADASAKKVAQQRRRGGPRETDTGGAEPVPDAEVSGPLGPARRSRRATSRPVRDARPPVVPRTRPERPPGETPAMQPGDASHDAPDPAPLPFRLSPAETPVENGRRPAAAIDIAPSGSREVVEHTVATEVSGTGAPEIESAPSVPAAPSPATLEGDDAHAAPRVAALPAESIDQPGSHPIDVVPVTAVRPLEHGAPVRIARVEAVPVVQPSPPAPSTVDSSATAIPQVESPPNEPAPASQPEHVGDVHVEEPILAPLTPVAEAAPAEPSPVTPSAPSSPSPAHDLAAWPIGPPAPAHVQPPTTVARRKRIWYGLAALVLLIDAGIVAGLVVSANHHRPSLTTGTRPRPTTQVHRLVPAPTSQPTSGVSSPGLSRRWTFPPLSGAATQVTLIVSNPGSIGGIARIRTASRPSVVTIHVPAGTETEMELAPKDRSSLTVSASIPVLAERLVIRGGHVVSALGTPAPPPK